MPHSFHIKIQMRPSIELCSAEDYHKYVWDTYYTPLFYVIILPKGIRWKPNMGDFKGRIKQVIFVGKPIRLGAKDADVMLAQQQDRLKHKLNNLDASLGTKISMPPQVINLFEQHDN